MLKKAAIVYGAVFVIIGLAGFIPALTPQDSEGMRKLLGIFVVDGTHNIIHLASGLLALAASRQTAWAHKYFQGFGLVYALVAIVGFIQGHTVLGLFHTNLADHLLHLALAVTMLYLGFVVKDDE